MVREHSIVLYTKKGCCLCDDARDMLQRHAGKLKRVILEVDITSDPELFERYKTIIPVIIIDNKYTLGARIEEEELLDCLKAAGK